MKRRILVLCCGLAMALTLTACGGTQGNTSSAGESQAVETSSQVESSQPQLKPEPRTAEIPQESQQEESASTGAAEVLALVQEESGAEAGYEPRITLFEDGTFQFFVCYYDGTSTVSGTYVENGGAYVLTPTGDTAQGTGASGAGEMELTPSGEGYVYSGEQRGLTCDGAVFLSEEA